MRKKLWHLVFNHARIDVMMGIDKGKIVRMSINLALLEDDKKYDVVRWDTAHGYLHKHEFWRSEKSEKVETNKPLDEIFRKVYGDLKVNWKEYTEKMKRKLIGV